MLELASSPWLCPNLGSRTTLPVKTLNAFESHFLQTVLTLLKARIIIDNSIRNSHIIYYIRLLPRFCCQLSLRIYRPTCHLTTT
jgi:hypothetical protein